MFQIIKSRKEEGVEMRYETGRKNIQKLNRVGQGYETGLGDIGMKPVWKHRYETGANRGKTYL